MIDEKEIIEKIESDSDEDNSIFAFCHEENNQDNEHIKANKDGLLRFASYLLRIAYQIDPKPSVHDESSYPISQKFLIPNEGLRVYYLKYIAKRKSDFIDEPAEKGSLRDKLVAFGCFGLIILFVVCGMVGVYSIVTWIF